MKTRDQKGNKDLTGRPLHLLWGEMGNEAKKRGRACFNRLDDRKE